MVRESAWKRTKAYIRRMRGNRAGGWIALLLLFLVEVKCVTSTTTVTNKTIQYRLPSNVIPISYDIKVTPLLDEGNSTFNGETKILIKVLNETSNITLHAYYDLNVNENATSLMDVDGKLVKPISYKRDNVTDFLTLNFERSIKPGNYSLNFKFAGNINNESVGIHKSSYINAENKTIWVLATRFSPTNARRVFPCWDEPALKATFNISIKHYSNYTAASNMPMKNQIDAGNGNKWTVFNITPIMSTYLVGFVVSDFQCISNGNKSINTCGQKENLYTIKFFQAIAGKVLPELEQYTGIPFPLPKLDIYIIPKSDFYGMENWGLIIFPAYTQINNNSSYSTKQTITVTFIRQLAHQWFGNLVTPAWWKYSWLKLGLSRYIQVYITDKIFPEWESMNVFITRISQCAFSLESSTYQSQSNAEPNSPAEIKSYFSLILKEKAPIIIHMLSHIIGEENLRKGIRIYLKNHQYGIATSDDLWNALQQVYDLEEQMKIKEIMDPWLKQKGYPVVKVIRNYETGTAMITQSANLLSEISNKWYIPINYATKSDPSCTCTRATHWLKPEDTNVTIEGLNKDDWLVINLKLSGYYRVDYDEANWFKLAEYLNSDNFTVIHVLNRVQIMNDLFYMIQNNRQNVTTFLEVTKYLSRETDYIAWRQAFDSFSSLRMKIQDKKFSENLKKYVSHLIKNLIDKIGFEERLTDTYMMKRWRSEILTSACCYGHTECRKVAGNKLVAFLENPKENPMPSNLEYWIWNSGVYNEKAKTLMQKKIESGAYEYMKYMNVGKDNTFYREFIEKALTNSTIPKNVTRIALGQLRMGDAENWDYAVDYLMKNFDRIYKYFNDTEMVSPILHDYLWATPSLNRIKKISEFFDKNNDRIPSWMKKGITEQTKNLEWSETNAPTFNNWFESELSKITQIA